MGVRVVWKDNNRAEEGHRVYRATAPMDPLNLPAPIATPGPDMELYDDADVVEGTTYYYRVGAFIGGVERVSEEVSVEAVAPAGWQPSQLFLGGEYGGAWDLTDWSKIWADTARTNPISDGAGIALADDISGTGLYLHQPGGDKLIARAGAPNYAEGSGSSTRLLNIDLAAPVTYPFTFMIAGDSSPGSQGSLGLMASDNGARDRCVFALGTRNSDVTGPAVAVYNGTYSDASIGNAKGKTVSIVTFTAGAQYAENHLGQVSPSLNKSMPANCDRLTLGALIRSSGIGSYAGNYAAAMYIDRALTTQEKLDLIDWAKVKAGIV